MRVVLDSSVFVAAFRAEEPHSEAALALLEALDRSALEVVVPATVPIEVVAAIRRRTGRRRLASAVGDRLLTMRALHVLDLHAVRMISLLRLARSSGLRGMDAIVVGAAEEFNIPLVTFDVELASRARRFVTLLTAEQLIRRLRSS